MFEINPTVQFGHRTRRRVTINVTSLIDVLFLLLIFFMVSSTFAEQPNIKLELPRAVSAETSRVEPWVLSITRGRELFLDDAPVAKSDILARLEAQAAEHADKTLVLRADEEVPYGFFIEILDAVKRSGIKKISALTQPVPPS